MMPFRDRQIVVHARAKYYWLCWLHYSNALFVTRPRQRAIFAAFSWSLRECGYVRTGGARAGGGTWDVGRGRAGGRRDVGRGRAGGRRDVGRGTRGSARGAGTGARGSAREAERGGLGAGGTRGAGRMRLGRQIGRFLASKCGYATFHDRFGAPEKAAEERRAQAASSGLGKCQRCPLRPRPRCCRPAFARHKRVALLPTPVLMPASAPTLHPAPAQARRGPQSRIPARTRSNDPASTSATPPS